MNIVFLLRLWPIYGGGETVTICLANEMGREGMLLQSFILRILKQMNCPILILLSRR